MIIKLISVKKKPFKADDDSVVDYFWYKAIRPADNVTIQFGSTRGDHVLGQDLDLDIEKTENNRGGFTYKELTTK